MNAESFLTADEEQLVKEAIASAELKTTGEIRVHLSNRVEGDPMEACKAIFSDLKMYKTKQRNAVLVHIDVPDQSLVIWGDQGINDKVGDNFWKDVVDGMISYFRQEAYAEGLVKGIEAIGEKLQVYFPGHRDDLNELTNEISKELDDE